MAKIIYYDPLTRLDWKASALVATTVALPAYTRVADTITANANGAFPAVDGQAVPLNSRFVLQHGASGIDNGIYRLLALGVGGGGGSPWRAIRDDGFNSDVEVTSQARIPVSLGTLYGGRVLLLTTPDPIVINTTALTFVVDTPGLVTAGTAGLVEATGATAGSVLTTGAPTAGGAWLNDLNVQAGAITAPTNPTIDFGTGLSTFGGTVRLSGGLKVTSTLVTAAMSPYAIVPTDCELRCDAVGGAIQVTLPAVATSAGRCITVYDWTGYAAANNITIAAQGGETVNGAASVAVITNYGGAELRCEGAVWRTLQATV